MVDDWHPSNALGHEQTELEPGGPLVDVDLAPVLRALNAAGATTHRSCRGNPGHTQVEGRGLGGGYIDFNTHQAAARARELCPELAQMHWINRAVYWPGSGFEHVLAILSKV